MRNIRSAEEIHLGGALIQRTPVTSGIEIPSRRMYDARSGPVGKANYEMPLANRKSAAMSAAHVEARRKQSLNINGEGLYAGPRTGHGLYAGGGLYANSSKAGYGIKKHHQYKTARKEIGSIGIRGNLLHSPQALESQPFAVNFVWGNTLPPFYQKFNRS